MAYVENILDPDEKIVCRARVRAIAYIYAILELAVMMTPGRMSGLASTELALTDKRVLGRVGMLRRKYIAWPYANVEVASVQQGLFGKLFDYGSILITNKDGGRVRFRGIAEPLDIKLQIDDAVEMAVLGRKLSQTVMDKF